LITKTRWKRKKEMKTKISVVLTLYNVGERQRAQKEIQLRIKI
jgi:hypothetical protein